MTATEQAHESPQGGWQPLRVLGADSTLSIALPAANPRRSQLYAPRGVLLDTVDGGRTTRVIAADTGNHRLLVWPDIPGHDGADSAVVVGQRDATTEGPQAAGRGPECGLNLPTGLARMGNFVLVADGWNHRVLAYDAALDRDDPAPVAVLGQPSLSDVEPNAGHDVGASTFYWPFGLLAHDGWLWVADTGNRRVLGWHTESLPLGRPADVVLGQHDSTTRDENRGVGVGPASFRWPHALAVVGGTLWVADAGNHRLLGWRLPLVDDDRPADLVLGQRDFTTAFEQPHVAQGGGRLRFPYAVAALGRGGLAVADTANNRVLVRPKGADPQASHVLGQDNLDAAGENRWTAVTADSLCWPYGLSASTDARYGQVLAIADSGNNRVVLWHHLGVETRPRAGEEA